MSNFLSLDLEMLGVLQKKTLVHVPPSDKKCGPQSQTSWVQRPGSALLVVWGSSILVVWALGKWCNFSVLRLPWPKREIIRVSLSGTCTEWTVCNVKYSWHIVGAQQMLVTVMLTSLLTTLAHTSLIIMATINILRLCVLIANMYWQLIMCQDKKYFLKINHYMSRQQILIYTLAV